MSDCLPFLEALFHPYGAARGLTCEIRSISAADRSVHQRWFGLSHLANAAGHCDEMAPTHDVYVGVLPRTGRGGLASDVAAAGWLYCDLDAGADGLEGAAQLLARFAGGPTGMKPNMLVATASGGMHCYWRFSRPVQLDTDTRRQAYRDLLRRLVRAIGGEAPGAHADIAATDAARILRVPATLYHKTDPPARVRWYCPSSETQTASWWNGNLPMLPILTPTQAAFIRRRGLPRTPRAPSTDTELIERACDAANGAGFAQLFAGDTSGHGNDESRADMALMAHLAFWTDGDPARMERLFGQSELGRREKWQTRPDYRKRTIERALGVAS